MHREIPGTPYIKMGRIANVSRPRATVLTDRADGSEWFLSDDEDNRIKLISPPPAFAKRVSRGITFGAFDGPEIGVPSGRVRLFVRDGALGFDAFSAPGSPYSGGQNRTFTLRNPPTSTIFEILRASLATISGALVYEQTS